MRYNAANLRDKKRKLMSRSILAAVAIVLLLFGVVFVLSRIRQDTTKPIPVPLERIFSTPTPGEEAKVTPTGTKKLVTTPTPESTTKGGLEKMKQLPQTGPNLFLPLVASLSLGALGFYLVFRGEPKN